MPSVEVSGEGWELCQGGHLQDPFSSTAPGEGQEDISGKFSVEEKIQEACGYSKAYHVSM